MAEPQLKWRKPLQSERATPSGALRGHVLLECCWGAFWIVGVAWAFSRLYATLYRQYRQDLADLAGWPPGYHSGKPPASEP